MKSLITNPLQLTYPYIGVSSLGIIVLFVAPKTGVQIGYDKAKLGGNKEVGEYADNIMEDNFTLFAGEITLSN